MLNVNNSCFPELMFQWSVIVALLMKETDGLIARALPPTLSSILLRLFAASAKHLHGLISASSSLTSPTAASKHSPHKVVDESLASAWESLTEHLQKDFPRMLNRFKDNEDDNLEVLVQLLPYYDASSGSATAKGFKQCLQCVVEVFNISSNETVLQLLSLALKSWLAANKSNASLTKGLTEAVTGLIGSVMARMSASFDECTALLKQLETSPVSTVAKPAKAKRGNSSTQEKVIKCV